MPSLDDVLSHIDSQSSDSISRLFELLKIKSISTDSAYANDCITAADWLVDDLQSIGIDASRTGRSHRSLASRSI